MNELARKFFQEFKRVRFLSEEKEAAWSELSEIIPRGWFELSRVSTADRVAFVREYWQARLPYHPVSHTRFSTFFSQLDDVAVVLTATKEEEPLSAELVYSLYDNSSFFRGLPPATEEAAEGLYDELETTFPRDYLAFLKIHNGFGKLSSLGLFPLENIAEMREKVKELISSADPPMRVNPRALIPFYEEEGLFAFQCFYADWYPAGEMGNVYLSGIDYTMSDTSDWKSWRDNFAFPTFLEWLSEYLEGMSLSP